jgi:hypothetical protein
MAQDIEAARARAEARFKRPEAPAETEAARAERELRERTERLRAARLAQPETKRKGAEIRTAGKRTP